eukprot:3735-Heterococcus_DN1.PRE.2
MRRHAQQRAACSDIEQYSRLRYCARHYQHNSGSCVVLHDAAVSAWHIRLLWLVTTSAQIVRQVYTRHPTHIIRHTVHEVRTVNGTML